VIQALGASVEIVVADGGSVDGTPESVGARARVLSTAPGRGRQLNAGARASAGDALLFLHADTWLSPGAGTALLEALARPDVVGGCFAVALRGPSQRRPIARAVAAGTNLRSRLFRTATGDQAIFVRREVFEELGGFPEHDLFEDVLLYRQLRRRGRVVVLRPPARTSDRRWHRRGYTRTIATHLFLRLLLALGVRPDKLARLYRLRG
jgi:rSAM/selenodomain-associated transferase 2